MNTLPFLFPNLPDIPCCLSLRGDALDNALKFLIRGIMVSVLQFLKILNIFLEPYALCANTLCSDPVISPVN